MGSFSNRAATDFGDEEPRSKNPGGGGRVKEERKRERLSERPVASLRRPPAAIQSKRFSSPRRWNGRNHFPRSTAFSFQRVEAETHEKAEQEEQGQQADGPPIE